MTFEQNQNTAKDNGSASESVSNLLLADASEPQAIHQPRAQDLSNTSVVRGMQAASSLMSNFDFLDSNQDNRIDRAELNIGIDNTDDPITRRSFEDVEKSYNLVSLLGKDDSSGISKIDLQAMNSYKAPEYDYSTKGMLYYKNLNTRQFLAGAGIAIGGLLTTKFTLGGGLVAAAGGAYMVGSSTKEAFLLSQKEQEHLKNLYN